MLYNFENEILNQLLSKMFAFKIMIFLSINLDNYYGVISKGSLIILCNHDLIEVIHKEATSLTLKFETLLKK